jgi:hypothetical protein
MISWFTICFALFLQDQPIKAQEPSQEWTRKTSTENIVSIEFVSRRYEAKGKPNVWLVGVAHVADATFYEEVTSLLDGMDIVLYESVRPTGSRPPGGSTDEERIASTTISMEFIADIAKRSAEETGDIPESIEEVITHALLIDSRLASFVEDASVGAWGRPYAMQISPERDSISIWCFGSDGKLGGDGTAKDIVVRREILIPEILPTEDENKGIQAGMADALGLEFQLDALSYEKPNWFCSDLTIGEVEQKLEERGADSEILKAITGEAFTAKIASGMMKLIPMLDMLSGGGVKETARLLMIEILTMPDVEKMMDSVEPELAKVIIVDRNTEVLADIASTIEIVEDVSSIGVLYGAGHMKDLAERMNQHFGYVPVEERWMVAMSVNPDDSLLDEADMKRMRFMLRFQMYKANKEKNKLGE